jgi:uncharacterized protein
MYTHELGSGDKWSARIGKGKSIKFTAQEAGANVSLLLYHADNPAERYNMPDTLKAQHTSHLTEGHILMSDNGKVLASIVQDSLGWHDPIGGYIGRQQTDSQYGTTSYQNQLNDWYRSGEENFTMELIRQGLTTKDLVPNVNLFSKIACDDAGVMHFAEGHSQKGDTVTLRTEMDVILIVSNTPNPHDPSTAYPSVPVEVEITEADPAAEDDKCVNHLPENKRAFENTWNAEKLLTSGK